MDEIQLFFDEPALIQIDELYDIDNVPYLNQVKKKLPVFLEKGDFVNVVFALHVKEDDDNEDENETVITEIQKIYQVKLVDIKPNDERQFVGELIEIINDSGRYTDKFYQSGDLISFCSDHIYRIPLKKQFRMLKKKNTPVQKN